MYIGLLTLNSKPKVGVQLGSPFIKAAGHISSIVSGDAKWFRGNRDTGLLGGVGFSGKGNALGFSV